MFLLEHFARRLTDMAVNMRTGHWLSLHASVATIGLLATAISGVDIARAGEATSTICETAPARRPKSCYVGDYWMQLPNYSGASLRLAGDGQFQWFFNSPSGRRNSSGTWSLLNGSIQLVANQPDQALPVFELTSQTRWDDVAEGRLRLSLRDADLARAERQCPLFVQAQVRMSGPPLAPKPSPTTLATAKASVVGLNTAKKAYEDAAAAAVNAPPAQKSRLVDIAEQARHEWEQAGLNMEARHQEAGLALPALREPNLPAVCSITQARFDTPESEWKRGIAINIDDVGENHSVSGIGVTLTYASGRTLNLTTNTSGLAFAPFEPSARLIRVTLSSDVPQRKTRSFTIAPVAQSVLNFTVNGDLLTPPPFRALRLQSVGQTLVSTSFLPGRYLREQSTE